MPSARPVGTRFAPEWLFAALVLLLFADPLFFRRNFAGRDLLMYHLPVEREIHEAYASGALPLWSAGISGGRPLLPNPNTGSLYPVRPLLALLSFPLAFRVYPVLHWILAGIGMIRLGRALGAGRGAAWMGAVTYVFSGVGMTEVFYTNLHPGVALLPWLLWAAVRPVRSSVGRILPAAILLALDFYAGDVFTIGCALAAWAFWTALETERGRRAALAGELAAATVLAVLLALPQIVATFLWTSWTRRAVSGILLREATAFSLRPWRLLELVVPYPFGPASSLDTADRWAGHAFRNFFPTLFCGGLALLAFPWLRRGTRPGGRFVRAFALAAAAASVLPSLLPDSWSGWQSPVPLRYPEKLCIALVFALAVGVATGLDDLVSRRSGRGLLLSTVLLSATAALAALAPRAVGATASRLTGYGGAPIVAGRQIAAALAEAGLLWTASWLALRLARSGAGPAAAAVAVAMWTLVPVVASRRIAHSFPQDDVLGATPFARFAAREDPAGRFRELDASPWRPAETGLDFEQRHPAGLETYRRSWSLYAPLLWDRGTVLNVDPDVGDLSRAGSLRAASRMFLELPNAAALFASLSLRHAIRWTSAEPLPGFVRAGGNALQSWDESPSALPSVRIVSRWIGVASAPEALAALPRLQDGDVVIETGQRGSGRDAGSTLAVVSDRPGRVELTVNAKGPVWLFVLRGFWPYRTVLVDGEPVETAPAQLAFTALPVPAGAHRVVWSENVPGRAFSWIGPVAFLAAALLLLRGRAATHGLSSSS
jgi:hypothetical protein